MAPDKIVKVGNTNYNVDGPYNVDRTLCRLTQNGNYSGESIWLQDTGAERDFNNPDTIDLVSTYKYLQSIDTAGLMKKYTDEELQNMIYNTTYTIDSSKKYIEIDDQKGDDDKIFVRLRNGETYTAKELSDGYKEITIFNKDGEELSKIKHKGVEGTFIQNPDKKLGELYDALDKKREKSD